MDPDPAKKGQIHGSGSTTLLQTCHITCQKFNLNIIWPKFMDPDLKFDLDLDPTKKGWSHGSGSGSSALFMKRHTGS